MLLVSTPNNSVIDMMFVATGYPNYHATLYQITINVNYIVTSLITSLVKTCRIRLYTTQTNDVATYHDIVVYIMSVNFAKYIHPPPTYLHVQTLEASSHTL